MNAKELYQVIGQIDDDLILEAAEKTSATKIAAKRRAVFRAGLMAAAIFVMLAGGVWFLVSQRTVTWNKSFVGLAAKTSVPEECTARQMTKEEAAEYYGMILPDTLLANQKKASLTLKNTSIWVYENAEGEIIFDSSMISYEDRNQTRTVNIALSKAIPLTDEENKEALKASRISGRKVIFLVDELANDVLGAQWEQEGTSIRIRAEGIEKNEMIQIVKELIAQNTKGKRNGF